LIFEETQSYIIYSAIIVKKFRNEIGSEEAWGIYGFGDLGI